MGIFELLGLGGPVAGPGPDWERRGRGSVPTMTPVAGTAVAQPSILPTVMPPSNPAVGPFPPMDPRAAAAAASQPAPPRPRPRPAGLGQPPIPTARPTGVGSQPPAAPQRPGIGDVLGGLFTGEGADMWKRLAIGLQGMTMRPNQALIDMLQSDLEASRSNKSKNQTVAWLQTLGTDRAAQAAAALETGAIDAGTAVQFALEQGGDERTALQQNYEYALSQGMTPDEARAWVSNSPVVNVGSGKAETAFETESAKLQATTFDTMMKEGIAANAQLGQIDVIDQLLQSGVGGTADTWKAWAQDTLGVNIGAGGAVEALNATINQLVPSQRPPGSGTMSDRDVALFKSSLPQLVNSPEGNQIVVMTMRGMAEFKRQQGDIATAVALGQMSREEGLAALQQLPDPMKPAVDYIRQRFPGTNAPGSSMDRDAAARLLLGE